MDLFKRHFQRSNLSAAAEEQSLFLEKRLVFQNVRGPSGAETLKQTVEREITETHEDADKKYDDLKTALNEAINGAGNDTFKTNITALRAEFERDWNQLSTTAEAARNEMKQQFLTRYLDFLHSKLTPVQANQPSPLESTEKDANLIEAIHLTPQEKEKISKEALDTLLSALSVSNLPPRPAADATPEMLNTYHAALETHAIAVSTAYATYKKQLTEPRPPNNLKVMDNLRDLPDATKDTIRDNFIITFAPLIEESHRKPEFLTKQTTLALEISTDLGIPDNQFRDTVRGLSHAVREEANTSVMDEERLRKNHPILYFFVKLFRINIAVDNRNGAILGFFSKNRDTDQAMISIGSSILRQREQMRAAERLNIPPSVNPRLMAVLTSPECFPPIQPGPNFDAALNAQEHVKQEFMIAVSELLHGTESEPKVEESIILRMLNDLRSNPRRIVSRRAGLNELSIDDFKNMARGRGRERVIIPNITIERAEANPEIIALRERIGEANLGKNFDNVFTRELLIQTLLEATKTYSNQEKERVITSHLDHLKTFLANATNITSITPDTLQQWLTEIIKGKEIESLSSTIPLTNPIAFRAFFGAHQEYFNQYQQRFNTPQQLLDFADTALSRKGSPEARLAALIYARSSQRTVPATIAQLISETTYGQAQEAIKHAEKVDCRIFDIWINWREADRQTMGFDIKEAIKKVDEGLADSDLSRVSAHINYPVRFLEILKHYDTTQGTSWAEFPVEVSGQQTRSRMVFNIHRDNKVKSLLVQ